MPRKKRKATPTIINMQEFLFGKAGKVKRRRVRRRIVPISEFERLRKNTSRRYRGKQQSVNLHQKLFEKYANPEKALARWERIAKYARGENAQRARIMVAFWKAQIRKRRATKKKKN